MGHLQLVAHVLERLTTQIARWVQEQLEPKGVGFVQEAELGEALC